MNVSAHLDAPMRYRAAKSATLRGSNYMPWRAVKMTRHNGKREETV